MIKWSMGILGSLMLIGASLNLLIKLFASDAAVLRYAGASRDLDSPIYGIIISLGLLALTKIISELEDIREILDDKK